MKLLIVEDEIELAKALSMFLNKTGYSVDVVHNGQDALDYIFSETYDCILLDIMIPKIDGIEVLKKVRKEGIKTAIIMLTAKSEIEDKVLGLDYGADDYVPKPFSTKELTARIRAVTRRKLQGKVNNDLSFGDLLLNVSNHQLISKNGSEDLCNKEFQIMETLIANEGSFISAEKLFEKIWGYDTETDTPVIWVHISNLRRKLEKIGSKVKIVASRNVGYRLEVDVC